MVGLPYDCLANPLGAVRLTFDRAMASAAAASQAADPLLSFNGKDWGAIDLFRKFLFEDGGLSQVPILDQSSSSWIQPNTLVRYRGMVQDMFGNELYIGAFRDGSTWKTTKFTDYPSSPIPPESETRLWERRLLHCVPVPGQNSWTVESSCSQEVRNLQSGSPSQIGDKRQRDDLDQEGTSSSCNKKQKEDGYQCPSHLQQGSGMLELRNGSNSSDASSFSCLVKVYDVPESTIKLNDVFEFVGVYISDQDAVAHNDDTDDIMNDLIDDVTAYLPPSKVPRLHCLICQKLTVQDYLSRSHSLQSLPNTIKGIRESLLCHLTAILGNDGLAAQYVLLHLLSKIRARVDVLAVGKLSLNLINFTGETSATFGNKLTRTIRSLLPFSQVIPLTVEYLNTAVFQPRKNNQTGRLVTGALQLAQGTHITVDETNLQSGTLNSKGVENARLLKHLMEWQMVEYDFEYYKLEMAADVRLLIFSEGKSNILPADVVLPFRPTLVTSDAIASSEQLLSWRWYLATSSSLVHSNGPEMQQMMQDELVVSMREDRNIGSADLSRWLTMAQLISASFGETSLTLEHWRMVKEIERLRKERLR